MVKLKVSSNILKWPVSKLALRSHNSSLSTSSGTNDDSSNNDIYHNTSSSVSNYHHHHHHNQNNPNSANPKRWIHDDLMLINGHVVYLVKFLGNVEVEQPKGLEIVKDSIKKLEFQEHLKRSEGEKIKRVELTISIDGVAIRDPKSKLNIHQFPLHRISYCADDKSERKFLSFITKVQDGSDRHECFVFVSDKLSEEITLTIGQAFDLAYRKFLDASGQDFDTKKELVQARKRIEELERKVTDLEQKLAEKGHNPMPDVTQAITDRSQTDKRNETKAKPTILPPKALTTNLLKNGSTNQSPSSPTIDLSLATTKLQSLIDLP